MEFYWTCPLCGANLDPGEKCDCQFENDVNSKHHRHLKNFIRNLKVEDIPNGEYDH